MSKSNGMQTAVFYYAVSMLEETNCHSECTLLTSDNCPLAARMSHTIFVFARNRENLAFFVGCIQVTN